MGARLIRGSGVKETIPQVGRVSGGWLLVSSAAVVVASASTYLLFASRVADVDRGSLLTTLIVQTVLLLAGLGGLAVFTTHRIVGPWIAVRRVCEAVRRGERGTRLRLRAADQLELVERELNAMLDELTSSSTGDSAD